MILGVENRGSLYSPATEWHREAVIALREMRRAAGLSQQECAALMDVPLNSFRMWDSGLRSIPPPISQHARDALSHHARQHELLPLERLAAELGMHVRTLQAAARTGRLEVQFHTRSIYGRPARLSTRAASDIFKRMHYRRFAGQRICPLPLPDVPDDYSEQLKRLRGDLRLTQQAFARRIGAASKAVVYQWESRKRRPSPVFWQRVERLAVMRATRGD